MDVLSPVVSDVCHCAVYRHCLCAEQALCDAPVSVRPSICLSRHSAAAAACGGFAAERRVGTVQPAAAAPQHGGQQQMRTVPRRQLGRLQLLSDICCRAELSSKPAARRCSCRSTGQTDGRTDGRTPDRYVDSADSTVSGACSAEAP